VNGIESLQAVGGNPKFTTTGTNPFLSTASTADQAQRHHKQQLDVKAGDRDAHVLRVLAEV